MYPTASIPYFFKNCRVAALAPASEPELAPTPAPAPALVLHRLEHTCLKL